jgi:putative transposase
MSNYLRVRVPGGTYFFTVNLRERQRRLLVERIGDLRASFRIAHRARPFELLALVVLPEHLHCVWRLPDGNADEANRWAQIKAGFPDACPSPNAGRPRVPPSVNAGCGNVGTENI